MKSREAGKAKSRKSREAGKAKSRKSRKAERQESIEPGTQKKYPKPAAKRTPKIDSPGSPPIQNGGVP